MIVPPAPYTTQNPRFRGADMTTATQTRLPSYKFILEFRGNEVYGIAADGLTLWHLGTDGHLRTYIRKYQGFSCLAYV